MSPPEPDGVPCAACGATGTRTTEDGAGTYRVVRCGSCKGTRVMTQQAFRAWLDEQAEKTPIGGFDAVEVARRFQGDD